MEVKVALIPAYDEELTIAKVIVGVSGFVDKIVVCDDGSTDATGKIAGFLCAEVIRHGRNMGKGEALRSLFLKAITMGADEAVTVDADGQHDPKEIPKLLEALKDADIVIGGRKGIPATRAVGNLLLKGFEKMDIQSGFRAYRGSVLPLLMPSEFSMAVDTEIFRAAKEHGLRITQVIISTVSDVPSPHKTNMGLHFLDVLFTDFKLATFRHPMLLYGIPGVILLLAASYFAYGDLPELMTHGFGSVILLLMSFFFLSTALIIWSVVSLARRLER